VNKEIAIDTTFDPPWFSSVFTFQQCPVHMFLHVCGTVLRAWLPPTGDVRCSQWGRPPGGGRGGGGPGGGGGGGGGGGRLHSWKIRLTAVNDTPPCFRRIKGLENRENS
jgi:hypothetical protein